MNLKKISIFLGLFLLLAAPAFADDTATPQTIISDQCTPTTQTDDLPGILEAARGCCSHHGGMSGQCKNGRVVCRDGSISPSCKCRADTGASPNDNKS